jgi:subtilisin family serine protease
MVRACNRFSHLLCIALVFFVHASAALACPARFTFSDADRAAIAELRVAGKAHATVLLLVAPAAIAEASSAAALAGMEVRNTIPEIGYLRLRVRIDAVDTALSLPGLECATISKAVLFPFQRDDREMRGQSGQADQGFAQSLPDDNPYTALKSLGVIDFNLSHPTFDGRATTIAIVDDGFDPAHPGLGTALDASGAVRPKIAGWLPAQDAPDTDSLGTSPLANFGLSPSITQMIRFEPVLTNRVQDRYERKCCKLPSDVDAGALQIGFLDIEKPWEDVSTLHRHATVASVPSDRYVVLLDPGSGCVWIDLHRTGDFSRVPCLRDVGVNGDWGVLGSDNPETLVRESLAFWLRVDVVRRQVRFEFSSTRDHGLMVLGLAAGGRTSGHPRVGIATGASVLLSLTQPDYTHTWIERSAAALADPRADVVNWSGGDVTRPSDGSGLVDIAIARLVSLTRKTLVAAAGNSGPILGRSLTPALADGVVSVGSYRPRESMSVLTGTAPPDDLLLEPSTASGPTDDGRVYPLVLGISGTVSLASPMHSPQMLILDRQGSKTLPPGYAVSGGTSAAAPTVAGVVALLISAAKQSGISYDTHRIRTALISSAKQLPDVEIWRQGNGLVQVGDAWRTLRHIPADWRPTEIESTATVHTALGRRFTAANTGRGIFEREGWTVGSAAIRSIRFVRRSGPPREISYGVRWKGDVGAFRSDKQVLTLPLGVPVDFPVRILARRSGVSAAILDLMEPETGLIAYQTMNAVVASERLDKAHRYEARLSGVVPRLAVRSHFFDVSPNAETLRITVTMKGADARLLLAAPDGSIVPGATSTERPPAVPWLRDGALEYTIPRPSAGVWQLVIDNSGFADHEAGATRLSQAKFEISAAVMSAEKRVAVVTTDQIRATATFGLSSWRPPRLRAAGVSLGVQHQMQIDLSTANYQDVSFEVPVGTETLELQLEPGNASGKAPAIFLFDCTRAQPVLRASAATTGVVMVSHPASGSWKATIDARGTPSGHSRLRLVRTILHPGYGQIQLQKSTVKENKLIATFRIVPRPPEFLEGTMVARVGLFEDGQAHSRRNGETVFRYPPHQPYPPDELQYPIGEITFKL